MKKYSATKFRKMSIPAIETIITRAVYEGAIIFEILEDAGIIVGNGHHIAQKMANDAIQLFRERRI